MSLPGEEPERPLDKEEWREVLRRLRPEVSDEEFEADWVEMLALKRKHEAN